jgi:hypothetical protein
MAVLLLTQGQRSEVKTCIYSTPRRGQLFLQAVQMPQYQIESCECHQKIPRCLFKTAVVDSARHARIKAGAEVRPS